MAQLRKKKAKFKLAKKHDVAFVGEEPTNKDYSNDPVAYTSALSWYAYFGDSKFSHKYAIAHYRIADAEVAEKLQGLDPKYMSHILNLGWHSRMLDRGCTLPATALESMQRHIDEIPDLYRRQTEDKEKAAERARFAAKRVSALVPIIRDIDEIIDKWNGGPLVIEIRNLALKYGANPNQIKEVGDNYRELYEEFESLCDIEERDAIAHAKKFASTVDKLEKLQERYEDNGESGVLLQLKRVEKELVELKDADLRFQLHEAYKHRSKKDRIHFRDGLKKMIDDSGAVAQAVKNARANEKTPAPAPVKKRVSADKQTAAMRVLKEDTDLKLFSLEPHMIIGRQKVWVWNSKYKFIAYAEAENASGFEASGMAIKNVRIAQNRGVKKPEEFFRGGFPTVAKRREVLFESLNTKMYEWNPRLNENCVILAVE